MPAASSPAATPTPAPAPKSALLTAEDERLLSSATTHEKLLLSQAVFEKGTDDWQGVAALIKGHKLLKAERGDEWFGPKVRKGRLRGGGLAGRAASHGVSALIRTPCICLGCLAATREAVGRADARDRS